MKAIVVDDSKAVRMILGRVLASVGYQVEEAANGVQAWALLSACPEAFALALLDWNMPNVNGFQLLQQIRSDRRFASLVIIMVTTETELAHVSAALAAGANEYVMKPFTREILVDKIQLTGLPVGERL